MYSAGLLYHTRERDLETIHPKESSYRPCVLFKNSTADGNLTASLFKCISQQISSVSIRLSFFVRQLTTTVRKFRSKTDDHTEGKSCF